jgi:dihydrofolate reductase
MNISIIVAAGSNNAIGKNNSLIWHIPADMKFFKEKTTGHCIITGRKNYESIPEKFRPLPNRTNIIITRQRDYKAPGTIITGSIEEALEKAKAFGDEEIFIIGGGDIFRQSLHLVDTIYLTEIRQAFDADVFFPELDKNLWKEVSRVKGPKDEKNKYDYFFVTYKRK